MTPRIKESDWHPFTGDMKLADLLDRNHSLTHVLSRLGIPFGFGDATVREVCVRAGVDPDSFLLLCNIYTFKDFQPSGDALRKVRLPDIVCYLRGGHDHYMSVALARLGDAIEQVIAPCDEARKDIIRRFFTGYRDELAKHFAYEESVVFPSVESLLGDSDLSVIVQYDEDHTNVEEKLGDLKNIVMKYLPPECDNSRIAAILDLLYALEEDFACHTRVEDAIVRRVRSELKPEPQEPGQDREELSEREKEILVCVAQGLLNKEIADRCNLSVHTVITHRKNITRKTGIKTVAGLTVYALLNNLIEINPDA